MSKDGRPPWRALYSHLFERQDFRSLRPNARLVLLTLRLCPQATIAGAGTFYTDVLAAYTGLNPADLENALLELETRPSRIRSWIVREGPFIWIRNGLELDPMISLTNDNHRVGIDRVLRSFPSRLAEKFRKHYGLGVSPPPSHAPSPPPSHALPRTQGDSSSHRVSTSTSTKTSTKNENEEPPSGGPPPAPQTPGGAFGAPPSMQRNQLPKEEQLALMAARAGLTVEALRAQMRTLQDGEARR